MTSSVHILKPLTGQNICNQVWQQTGKTVVFPADYMPLLQLMAKTSRDYHVRQGVLPRHCLRHRAPHGIYESTIVRLLEFGCHVHVFPSLVVNNSVR